MNIPFVGPTYNLDDRPASVQRTVNMVPLPNEPGNERAGWVFKDVPGLSSFAAAPTPPALPKHASWSGANGASEPMPAIDVQIGDVLVIFTQYAYRVSTAPTTPDGWTMINDFQVSGSWGVRLRAFGRIADGTSADSNVPTPVANGESVCNSHVISTRGVRTTYGGYNFPQYLTTTASIDDRLHSISPTSTPTTPAPWFNIMLVSSELLATAPPASYAIDENTSMTVFAGGPSHVFGMASAVLTDSAPTETPGVFTLTGNPGTTEGRNVLIRLPLL